MKELEIVKACISYECMNLGRTTYSHIHTHTKHTHTQTKQRDHIIGVDFLNA